MFWFLANVMFMLFECFLSVWLGRVPPTISTAVGSWMKRNLLQYDTRNIGGRHAVLSELSIHRAKLDRIKRSRTPNTTPRRSSPSTPNLTSSTGRTPPATGSDGGGGGGGGGGDTKLAESGGPETITQSTARPGVKAAQGRVAATPEFLTEVRGVERCGVGGLCTLPSHDECHAHRLHTLARGEHCSCKT